MITQLIGHSMNSAIDAMRSNELPYMLKSIHTIEDAGVLCVGYLDESTNIDVIGLIVNSETLVVSDVVTHRINLSSALNESQSELGLIESVTFLHPGLGEIEAKIDTGADMCSFHASDVSITNDTVTFTVDSDAARVIKMSVADKLSIQSASNEERRCVVHMTIEIDGTIFHDVPFNLADRSNMSHRVLIGSDLLKDGEFMINTLKEAVDVDMIISILTEYVNNNYISDQSNQ